MTSAPDTLSPARPIDHRRRRHLLSALAAAGALALPAPFAHAQPTAWPSRPIRVIVNFPAGSSPDVLIRIVSPLVRDILGQPLAIDNRPGASGIIGANAVAKSAPDGYTLLMTAGSVITTNPHMIDSIPYDTKKDLVPVAAIARMALFLVTRADLPVSNVQEFLAYLKSPPRQLTYGSAGNATGLHIAGEMLNVGMGSEAAHVPYQGAAPALRDLLAGQIDFYFDPGISFEHVRAGRLKMLAVGALNRLSAFPNVPTLHESGLPGFDAGTTHGVYAPAGTPASTVAALNRAINQALNDPDLAQKIRAMGAEPQALTVQGLAEQMDADSARYGRIVRERNIRAN